MNKLTISLLTTCLVIGATGCSKKEEPLEAKSNSIVESVKQTVSPDDARAAAKAAEEKAKATIEADAEAAKNATEKAAAEAAEAVEKAAAEAAEAAEKAAAATKEGAKELLNNFKN